MKMKMYKIVFYFDVCEKVITDFVQADDEVTALDKIKLRYGSNSVIAPQVSFKRDL